MNQNKIIFLMPLIITLLGVKFSQAKETLVLQTKSQDIISALPILDNMIIKFDGDSVIIKNDNWSHNFGQDEITFFNHVDELRSDVKVKVTTNDSLYYPVPNVYVTLHNLNKDDVFGVVQISDQDGIAHFRNIPVGYYELFVHDIDSRFNQSSWETLITYNDNIEALLHERVMAPYLLHYNIETGLEGFYLIWLDWESNLTDWDYTFYIYVNDVLHGLTNTNSYEIDNLPPGEYEIKVIAQSNYGNIDEEGRKLILHLDDFCVSSVKGLNLKEEDNTPLFDLKGQIIKVPTPGIYIRNGKKIIITERDL